MVGLGNGEFFSYLLYSSLKAIFIPPAKPGVAFGPTKTKKQILKWVSAFLVHRSILYPNRDSLGKWSHLYLLE